VLGGAVRGGLAFGAGRFASERLELGFGLAFDAGRLAFGGRSFRFSGGREFGGAFGAGRLAFGGAFGVGAGLFAFGAGRLAFGGRSDRFSGGRVAFGAGAGAGLFALGAVFTPGRLGLFGPRFGGGV
jgi:hypothetical protein